MTPIQRKIKISKKKLNAFLKDKDNRKYIILLIGVFLLFILFNKYGTKGEGQKTGPIVVPPIQGGGGSGGGAGIDYGGSGNALGNYEIVKNGKTYTFSNSPYFELTVNDDGSITDTTSGLVHGNPTMYNGRMCVYMFGYSYLHNNGNYKTLQNIQLPDGVYTPRRFDCNSDIPNFQHFKNQIHGYPESDGVNEYNATLHEVNITIRSNVNPGIPAWMKITRFMNWPANAPNKPIGKSIFAIECMNEGDTAALYHSKGVHTPNNFDSSNNPNTFRTYKWPYDLTPGAPLFSDGDLDVFLVNHINQWGLTPISVITDEVQENAQGQDPNINSRTARMYKGGMNLFRSRYPGINKKDTNMFGGYGLFDFGGYLNKDAIYNLNRTQLAAWIRDRNNFYFQSGFVDDCNVNAGYYMYNSVRNIPFELLTTNERVKVPTMEIGKESDWAVFATTLCQTLVMDNSGAPMGVEESHTGEIIPYANGEIWRYPATNSMIQEHRTLGFWARLISRRGTMIWGHGLWGKDVSKVDYYTEGNWPIKWRPLGASNWQNYVPGQNGAPLNADTGLSDTLYATVVDATKLGHDEADDLTGDDYTLYYASYTSSRKTFVAAPGDAGYHLNGFGPLNLNMLAFKDAYDQGCGASVIGVNANGKFGVYWNGSLSVDEYEDNVILTHAGMSVNLDRVYGRQTKIVKFS